MQEGWTDEINGLAGYQHPARWNNNFLSPKADYFSELIIYTSIKALAEQPTLWRDLNIEDTDTMLFSAEDIKSGGSSSIFSIVESIPSCKDLLLKIKEFLSFSTIEELQPLEEIAHSVVEDLSGKWKDNGYQPSLSYDKRDIDRIISKW